MDKKIMIIIGFIFILIILLCGCQEQTENNQQSFENIELESDIVDLAYGKIDFVKNNDEITRVNAEYRLKNIIDRDINVNVSVEFYDENNNLLYTSDNMTIIALRAGDEEDVINTATYDGEFVSQVDHVKIKVSEI